MTKAQRLQKSTAARQRRKSVKQIVAERTENLYSRLRRLRKKTK